MTPEELTKMVTTKAQHQVQKDIEVLRKAVKEALTVFCGRRALPAYAHVLSPGELETLQAMCKDQQVDAWPSWVWRDREEQIMKDVLSGMDVLQQLRHARAPEGDNLAGPAPPPQPEEVER